MESNHAAGGTNEMRNWRTELEDLKQRVERDFGADNVFFFKSVPTQGVAGYWGAGPTVFVAERPTRPSTKGRQATRAFANRFFDALKRHHFEDAHLTDLVKHFPGTGLGMAALIDRNWPYFVEELSIVDAKIVVAVGQAVFEYVNKRRLEQELLLIPHYAYRFGPPDDLRRKLDDALDRVAKAQAALKGS